MVAFIAEWSSSPRNVLSMNLADFETVEIFEQINSKCKVFNPVRESARGHKRRQHQGKRHRQLYHESDLQELHVLESKNEEDECFI